MRVGLYFGRISQVHNYMLTGQRSFEFVTTDMSLDGRLVMSQYSPFPSHVKTLKIDRTLFQTYIQQMILEFVFTCKCVTKQPYILITEGRVSSEDAIWVTTADEAVILLGRNQGQQYRPSLTECHSGPYTSISCLYMAQVLEYWSFPFD